MTWKKAVVAASVVLSCLFVLVRSTRLIHARHASSSIGLVCIAFGQWQDEERERELHSINTRQSNYSDNRPKEVDFSIGGGRGETVGGWCSTMTFGS